MSNPPVAQAVPVSSSSNGTSQVPLVEGKAADDNASPLGLETDRAFALRLAMSPELPTNTNIQFRQLARRDSAMSILERDEHKPYCTYGIILVDTIVLIAELIVNYKLEGKLIESFNDNPMFGPSVDTMLLMGAKLTEPIVRESEWWRLVVPMFLHAGIVHLVVNMLFLWFFGAPLERAFGFSKFAYIYVASGFTGVVFSGIFLPEIPSVGASGACYGLIGATWADFILNCSYFKGNHIKTFVQLGFGTALNLSIGLLPYLDNFAHIGGLLAGFMTGMSSLSRRRYNKLRQEKPEKLYQVLCSVSFGLIAPLVIVFLTLILFAQTDSLQECDWCHYMSCIPTKWWDCDMCATREYTFEVILGGDESGNIVLTCPGDIGQFILEPPLPSLETSGQQNAVCEEYCFG